MRTMGGDGEEICWGDRGKRAGESLQKRTKPGGERTGTGGGEREPEREGKRGRRAMRLLLRRAVGKQPLARGGQCGCSSE